MKEHLYIGSTPSYEDCAQVGKDDYAMRSRKELKAFQNQILRAYPVPAELEGSVSLGIREGEVVVYYDEDEEVLIDENTGEEIRPSFDYALSIEADKKGALKYWDEEAKKDLLIEPELKKGEFVNVSKLPNCDICSSEGSVVLAEYDAKLMKGMYAGSWSNLCGKHFGEYGCELGLGRGQKLIIKQEVVCHS